MASGEGAAPPEHTGELQSDGTFAAFGPTPWSDYAMAIAEAKEEADCKALRSSRFPAVTVRVYKMYSDHLEGLRTDHGTPDLTTLPDWPRLLACLRHDLRRNSKSAKPSSARSECEKLFLSMGWTARSSETALISDNAPLVIAPPRGRPIFGSGLEVIRLPYGSRGLKGMLMPSVVSESLQLNDVIIGLDGVLITRGMAQLEELIAASPDTHTFVVRRRGAPPDAKAEAALEALVPTGLKTEPPPPFSATATTTTSLLDPVSQLVVDAARCVVQ